MSETGKSRPRQRTDVIQYRTTQMRSPLTQSRGLHGWEGLGGPYTSEISCLRDPVGSGLAGVVFWICIGVPNLVVHLLFSLSNFLKLWHFTFACNKTPVLQQHHKCLSKSLIRPLMVFWSAQGAARNYNNYINSCISLHGFNETRSQLDLCINVSPQYYCDTNYL